MKETTKTGYLMNRITEQERFRVVPSSVTVESYVGWIERGAFDYNAEYQRDYVWKNKQQQEFLHTLISGFPLGTIAVAKHKDWLGRNGPWLEVVDGKQRLMTLEKFIMGEIALRLKGMDVWWSKLTRPEQLAFGRPFLPLLTLDGADKAAILEYFIAVNFSGVPQSTKHKQLVMQMREDKKNGN